MNWLLISSSDDEKELVKKTLSELFPNAAVFEASEELSSLRSVYGKLNDISSCIILSEKISTGTELILGFLCGKNIKVITDAKIDKKAIKCFGSLELEKDVASVCLGLRKNRRKIEKDVAQKEAYSYLFAHGIPFSPDHFSKYIEKGNLEICACYLAAGMDVNSRDKDGTPMLNLAVRNDNAEAVEWLLEKGADADLISEDRGYSALMDAVWRGNLKITKLLLNLKKKPDVNLVSKEGQTMIILAVGADNAEISEILCNAGADVDIKDQMGMSAYDYARLFKKDRLLSILEKYHKES